MTVLEIVCSAIKILGDNDLYNYLKDGSNNNSFYENEKSLLLIAYNQTITQVISYYPLKFQEVLSPNNGAVEFKEFKYNPYKIISVKTTGDYDIYPTKIVADSDIDVVYYYMPKNQEYNEVNVFDETIITPLTISYGVLSEYLTYKGRYQESVMFFDKFVNALKDLTKNYKIKRLKSREWF